MTREVILTHALKMMDCGKYCIFATTFIIIYVASTVLFDHCICDKYWTVATTLIIISVANTGLLQRL